MMECFYTIVFLLNLTNRLYFTTKQTQYYERRKEKTDFRFRKADS